MKTGKIMIFFSTLLLFSTVHAEDRIYTGLFSNTALDGYDPVAYFTLGRPMKGKKRFQLEHQGANWYFSSEEHRRLFQADPEKYAPRYGGYCAWAVAHGTTARGDPHQWTIRQGRLYLNYNADIQKDWLADPQRWIREADNNWPAVLE
jgi:YHS domain-containing protein